MAFKPREPFGPDSFIHLRTDSLVGFFALISDIIKKDAIGRTYGVSGPAIARPDPYIGFQEQTGRSVSGVLRKNDIFSTFYGLDTLKSMGKSEP